MKSTQVAPHTDAASFRRTLQEELARRCTKNGQYSLRELRRLPAEQSGAAVRVLRDLTEDTLAVISGFEHYAILELTHLDDFRPDVSWIARVLGLDPDAVNVAVARLCRLGLLKMAGSEEWIDCTGDITHLLDGIAYEAVWGLSERAREHAIRSMVATPDRLRDFSSTTLAIDQRKLPEALKILTRARSEILRVLSASDRRDHVYHLDISLIPLTGESRTERKEDPDG